MAVSAVVAALAVLVTIGAVSGHQTYGGGGGGGVVRYQQQRQNCNQNNCNQQQFQQPSAVCEFNSTCFQFSPDCTITNAFPFERKGGVTCDECIALCYQRTGPPPFMCRSVVYDGPYQTCDLFAVQVMSLRKKRGNHRGGNSKSGSSPNLSKYPGRIYLQPTGFPGCGANGTTNGTGPATGSCSDGQTAKLVAVQNHEFPGASGQDVANVDQQGCEDACTNNQGPDGTNFDCKSAQFTDGKCTISTSEPETSDQLQTKEGTTYYQKFCFDDSLVANCPAKVWEEWPQYILVGFARVVVDAESYEDCLFQCLSASQTQGFDCRSGMFYFTTPTQNCILNSEDKNDQSENFAEDEEQVTYFEPLCGAGAQTRRKFVKTKSLSQALRAADVPLAGNWTMWSPCKPGVKTQFRYTICRKGDVRKCPHEERPCPDGISDPKSTNGARKVPIEGHLSENEVRRADALGSASCKALKQNGKKICSIGVRFVGNKRKYCSRPVDC